MRAALVVLLLLPVSLGSFGCDSGNSTGTREPDAGPPPDPDAAPEPEPDASPDAAPAPEPDAGVDPDPLPEGVTTLAGTGDSGSDDGLRGAARFNNPVNVAVGSDGAIYIADFDNGLVREATDLGLVSTLTARSGFSRPFGMVVGASGVLYVQTDRNSSGGDAGALWSIDTTTGVATVVRDDIGRPRGMAELADGRLVMAFYQEHTVKVFDPSNPETAPVVVAGATGMPGRDDGIGAAARFNQPYDVVAIGETLVVVSDLVNNVLRQVDIATGEVTTFAGTGDPGTIDGPLLTAQFNGPQGLAIDADGALYVTEIEGYVIRRIESGTVATFAGNRTGGHRDSVTPLDARFFGLEGIAAHPSAPLLYVSDGSRGDPAPFHRVRRVTLPVSSATAR